MLASCSTALKLMQRTAWQQKGCHCRAQSAIEQVVPPPPVGPSFSMFPPVHRADCSTCAYGCKFTPVLGRTMGNRGLGAQARAAACCCVLFALPCRCQAAWGRYTVVDAPSVRYSLTLQCDINCFTLLTVAGRVAIPLLVCRRLLFPQEGRLSSSSWLAASVDLLSDAARWAGLQL